MYSDLSSAYRKLQHEEKAIYVVRSNENECRACRTLKNNNVQCRPIEYDFMRWEIFVERGASDTI